MAGPPSMTFVALRADEEIVAPAVSECIEASGRHESERAHHSQCALIEGGNRHAERRRGELAPSEGKSRPDCLAAQALPGQVGPQAPASVESGGVIGAAGDLAVHAERAEPDQVAPFHEGVETALGTGQECLTGTG